MRTLSFLIPAYNCDDTIGAAVESALAQETDVPIEIVVVDDGSEDDTREVVNDLARSNAAVRLIAHPENRGGGPARNTAAKAASGDLLYMLDSDNMIPDGCVQAQLDTMRATGAQAVSVSNVQFFDGTTGEHRHRWDLASEGNTSSLRHVFERLDIPAAHGNYLFTRDLFDRVGGYESDLGAMDAWSFGFKQLAHGTNVALAPDTHYMHRIDRPRQESYWTRDERAGINDRNALTAISRNLDRLPPDLRWKVDALGDNDPFFLLVAAGAFRPTVDVATFKRRIKQARQRRRGSALSRTRKRLGSWLGR